MRLGVAAVATTIGLLAPAATSESGPNTSLYAIRLASSAYRVSYADMVSVARCESRLDPLARNPSSGAGGLFQFLPSTWENQGLAGFSVYDAAANALATARIVSREGWRQWSCRP